MRQPNIHCSTTILGAANENLVSRDRSYTEEYTDKYIGRVCCLTKTMRIFVTRSISSSRCWICKTYTNFSSPELPSQHPIYVAKMHDAEES